VLHRCLALRDAARNDDDVVADGEPGFVVPIGDVEALADRLRRLRDDPALRAQLGSVGRARLRDAFSTERMVADVERVYEDARRR
jgi:rhamnosyl/mannosyltransferase